MKRKSLQQDQMGCTSRAVGFWGAKVFVLDTHPLCPFGFAMVAFNLWLKWILWWGQISRPVDSGDDDRSRFWQIQPPEDFLRQFWRIRSCSLPATPSANFSRFRWEPREVIHRSFVKAKLRQRTWLPNRDKAQPLGAMPVIFWWGNWNALYIYYYIYIFTIIYICIYVCISI